MDLKEWIGDELTEARRRLEQQVLRLVPVEHRLDRPGGGSSITWGLFHVARHAELAVQGVLLGGDPYRDAWVDEALPGGCGLGEAEELIVETLDPAAVEAYLGRALDGVAAWLESSSTADLTSVPDSGGALAAAGVPRDDYGWLYSMWAAKPAAFFVRWEVIGHLGNHIGEMIATRNRLGLSPF